MFKLWGKDKTQDKQEEKKTEKKPAAPVAAKGQSPSAKTSAPKAEKREKALPEKSSSGGLKIKVVEKKDCQVTMDVNVPSDRVVKTTAEVYSDIQARARIPGFRQGKAPLEMVKKNFEEHARETVRERLLIDGIRAALDQEKLDAVDSPVVEKLDFEFGKPFSFRMKIECAPEVPLKDYKGLTLKKKGSDVTDEEVDKKVDDLLEAHSKLVAVPEGTGAAGTHFAVVDYDGFVDEKPLPNGKAENYVIDLSSKQTLNGFSEGLQGAKEGETRDVTVKFPEDYPQKDLAAKQATFKVTVKSLKEKKRPALDDEFAKDLGCEHLNDLRDRIRKNLQSEKERQVRQDLENQVNDALLKGNEFPLPAVLLKERTAFLQERLKNYLVQQGAKEEDLKKNEETMRAKNEVEAERQVRLSYILAEIGSREKLSVSDEEVDKVVAQASQGTQGEKQSEVRRMLEEKKGHIKSQLWEEKIYTYLIENAKLAEADK